MTLTSILQMENRIDALFKKVDQISDLEMRTHWSRYLCVLVSGYLEESTREILLAYTEKASNRRVASHVAGSLERFQNPNYEKTLQLIGSFDKNWRIKIDSDLGAKTKTAIDSINSLRNNIAHGGTTNVSYPNMQSYYVEAKRFIDKVQEMLTSH